MLKKMKTVLKPQTEQHVLHPEAKGTFDYPEEVMILLYDSMNYKQNAEIKWYI